MRSVEMQLRVFGAGFQRPTFSSWARARSAELKRLNVPHVVVVLWGPLEFTVHTFPREAPELAIRRESGELERSPWAPAAE